ncbi:DUF1801 domain-containing protein [Myxococcota bacterium]|nr:DUF1801 domain-containing protein [Myxococcota bacterium]
MAALQIPKTIDEYLARLPATQRAALERLRAMIRAAAPRAEECISYQLPTFKQDGMLVSFGAWKEHCALYGLSARLHGAFEKELARYDKSKGTIRFAPDAPLPASLVKKLVRARLAENAARVAARAADRSPKPAAAGTRAAARASAASRPNSTPTRRKAARPARRAGNVSATNGDVDVFLNELRHPLKHEIELVRAALLASSPTVREEVKWNAPSFKARTHFATFHLRAKRGFQLVLHRGATTKAPTERLPIDDPTGLLAWRATDRALVTFDDAADVARKLPALRSIVKQWLRHV